MKYASHVRGPFFTKDGHRVFLGLTRMNDKGKAQLPGKLNLFTKSLTLDFTG